MSTREMALNIFNQLNEEQLQGFVAMFKKFIPTDSAADTNVNSEQAEREAAFNEILALSKHIPDLDEEAELSEWRKEKFGI